MDPIQLLVWLAIIAILVVAAWYILSQMQLPEPIGRIVMIVVVVIIAVVAVSFLYQFSGGGHSLKLR